MRSFQTSSFLIACLLTIPTDSKAGSFNQAGGQALLIASRTTEIATSFLNPNGTSITVGRYQKRERSLYLEYGLTSQFTFFGKLSRDRVALLDTLAFDGRGPTELGLQYQLLRRSNTAIALQAIAQLHSRDLQPANWLFGQKRTEPEIRALLGQSIYISGKKNFFEAQAGWRSGRADRPDELHLDLTHSVSVTPSTTMMTQLFVTKTTGNSHLPAQAYEERKAQVSLVRDFGPYSIQIGTFHTSSGRNVYSGKGALMALWLRL